MADYLPLYISHINETLDRESGEVRKSVVCKTVQPETISLNLSRVDAERIQRIADNQGNILMIPVRRGEFNGRAFTSIADGHIFKDSEVKATFELSDIKINEVSKQPGQSETVQPGQFETIEKAKPLFGNKAA